MDQEKNPFNLNRGDVDRSASTIHRNDVERSTINLNRCDVDHSDKERDPHKEAWLRRQAGIPTYGGEAAERDFFNVWTGQSPLASPPPALTTECVSIRPLSVEETGEFMKSLAAEYVRSLDTTLPAEEELLSDFDLHMALMDKMAVTTSPSGDRSVKLRLPLTFQEADLVWRMYPQAMSLDILAQSKYLSSLESPYKSYLLTGAVTERLYQKPLTGPFFFPEVKLGPSQPSKPPVTSTDDIEDALSLVLQARDDVVMDATICGIPGATLRRFIDELVATGAKPV